MLLDLFVSSGTNFIISHIIIVVGIIYNARLICLWQTAILTIELEIGQVSSVKLKLV